MNHVARKSRPSARRITLQDAASRKSGHTAKPNATTMGLIGALYPYDGAFCLLWASSCLLRWLCAVYHRTAPVHCGCPFVGLLLLLARLLGIGGIEFSAGAAAPPLAAGPRLRRPFGGFPMSAYVVFTHIRVCSSPNGINTLKSKS
jgi:hypothetical protein